MALGVRYQAVETNCVRLPKKTTAIKILHKTKKLSFRERNDSFHFFYLSGSAPFPVCRRSNTGMLLENSVEVTQTLISEQA